ncbi:MAG: hypothetical protein N2170_03320 [Bacteroidia bacterium]|nr:hypothetical protein [Bacteroidia bacterium]
MTVEGRETVRKAIRLFFGPVGAIGLAELIGISFLFTYHAEWEGGALRRFLLMDDAMISMSYARSLVEGCGLVWYCGAERVEGITNLGWTLYMALWQALEIAPEYAAFPILLTGLLTLGLHLWGIYLLGVRFFSVTVGRLAVWAMALLPTVWVWHSAGLETGALATLLVRIGLELERTVPRPFVLGLLSGLGTFLRMDFFIWALGAATGKALSARSCRPLFPVVLGGIGLGVGILLFRKSYYGDWWPNTYCLKVTDIPSLHRWVNGILSTCFHIIYNLPLWILAIGGLWRRRAFLFGGPILGVSLLYNIYVGGDIEEMPFSSNRFLFMSSTSLVVLAGSIVDRGGVICRLMGVLLIGHGVPLYPFEWGARWRALLGPVGAYIWKGRWAEENRYPILGVRPFPVERYLSPGQKVAVGFGGTYPFFTDNIAGSIFLENQMQKSARQGTCSTVG